MSTYRPCSGQSRGPREWGICLAGDRFLAAQWWRARDLRGRIRLFASYEAAERACRKLEAQHAPGNSSDSP